MARNFNGSGQYLKEESNPFTAAFPFSTSAWFYHTGADENEFVLSITNNNAGSPYYHTIRVFATGNDVIWRCQNQGTNMWINVGTRTQNQWHHVSGSKYSGSGGKAFLDGSKTTSVTAMGAFSGIENNTIGCRKMGGVYDLTFSGYIAEVAIWNVDLSDAEHTILSLGYSPFLVRPNNLVRYWPLVGRTSPETEHMNGIEMTLVGPTTAPHPRVIYPSTQIWTPPSLIGGLARRGVGRGIMRGVGRGV